MAATPQQTYTFVEIDPPDIATPVGPSVQLSQRPQGAYPPPKVPLTRMSHFAPNQFSSPFPRSQVRFATTPPSGGDTSFQPDPMQFVLPLKLHYLLQWHNMDCLAHFQLLERKCISLLQMYRETGITFLTV